MIVKKIKKKADGKSTELCRNWKSIQFTLNNIDEIMENMKENGI